MFMIEEVNESLEVTPPAGNGGTGGGAGAGGGAAGGAASQDLAKEIARTLKRTPLEQVTCRRVGDYHYRCNWWTLQDTTRFDNPSMLGSLVTTSRISKSEFVHAERIAGKLTVTVVTR
jgi:hypothetical protein